MNRLTLSDHKESRPSVRQDNGSSGGFRRVQLKNFRAYLKIQPWVSAMVRGVVPAILIMGWAFFPVEFAFAQRTSIRYQETSGELIEVPREVRRLLQEATDGIEKKRWSEATLALGILLGLEQQPGGKDVLSQDYFLPNSTDGQKSSSLRQQSRELLATLPVDGAKIAELRYGPKARNLLESGTEQNHWQSIMEVSRDFGFTEAGIEASWLLAEREIGQGDPYVAAMRLDRLLLQPSARSKLGLGIGVLAAACWKAAGQMPMAARSIQQLQSLSENGRVTWNGQSINLGKSVTDAEAAVASISIGSFKSHGSWNGEWALAGGRPDRNGEAKSGVPLPFVRWDARLHESVQQEDALSKSLRVNSSSTPMIPTRAPLILGNWVVAQTFDQRLIAINSKTGKIEWQNVFSGLPIGVGVPEMYQRDPRSDQLAHRVWGDLTTGQLASDGQRIYHVSDHSAATAADNMVLGNQRPTARSVRQGASNVLQCFSVAAQGKLLWEIGSNSGLNESRLANAFFLGPAVRYESELLAMAEINGEVYLMSLLPESGKLNWMQQLAASSGMPIAMDEAMKELGASPSISAGIAVCPTLNGYLVAFDLSTHTLRWSRQYRSGRNPVNGQGMNAFQLRGGRLLDVFMSHPADNAAVIAEGGVYYLPHDGTGPQENLEAVDLLSGKVLWRLQREQLEALGSLRFFAGVCNQVVVVVGDRGLMGLATQDGKQVWTLPFDLEGSKRVVGHGVRSHDRYYLPLSNQEIIEISLADGRVLDRVQVEKPLGNLVSTGDLLLSMSPFELTAYAVRDRIRSQIDIQSLQEPQTAWALARQGEFLLSEGKIQESLDVIQRANQLEPKNDEYQLLLMKAGMTALRSDFARYSSRVKQFEHLMGLGPEKTLYLTSLIRGHVEQKQVLPALERLLELSDYRYGQRDNSFRGIDQLDLDPTWTVQEDRWIATQIQRLFDSTSESQRKTMRSMVQPRIDTALQSILPIRRRLMRHWSDLPDSNEVVLKTTQELMLADEPKVAEALLQRLLESSDTAIQNAAKSQLVELYRMTKRPLHAVRYQNELLRPIEAIVTLPGLPDRQPSLMNSLENLKLVSRPNSAWPNGLVTSERLDRDGQLPRFSIPCLVQNGEGQILNGWSVSMRDTGIMLECPWGQESFEIVIDTTPRTLTDVNPRAFFLNSLIFLELNSEIIAIDTSHATQSPMDGVLWRQSFGRGSAYSAPNVAQSKATLNRRWGDRVSKIDRGYEIGGVTASGLIVTSGGDMICLDPLTGNRNWTRRGLSQPIHTTLQGNDLIALEPKLGQRSIIDVRDGQILEKQPWEGDFTYFVSAGPNFLLDRVSNRESPKMKLMDGRSGRVLLEREFQENTVASISENRFMAAIQPDGKIVLWDLLLAKEFIQAIEPSTELKSIKLARYEDTLVVLPQDATYRIHDVTLTNPSENPDKNSIDSSTTNAMVRGNMIALSTKDGHLNWRMPIKVYDFGFPMMQSRKAPAITLVRQFHWISPSNERTEQASVAVIDVRTGETVYSRDDWIPQRGDVFASSVDPSTNSLDLRFSGQRLRLNWTDEPSPPAPISAVGRTSEAELSARLANDLDPSESNSPGRARNPPRSPLNGGPFNPLGGEPEKFNPFDPRPRPGR